MGEQRLLRLLESRNRLLSGHSREIVQKFIQRIAALKVIEQGLERNSRAHEDRCAPENPWIAVNNGRIGRHGCRLSWTGV